jgi:hypothetical protein
MLEKNTQPWLEPFQVLCQMKIKRVSYRGSFDWHSDLPLLHFVNHAVDLELDTGDIVSIAEWDGKLVARAGPFVDYADIPVSDRSGKDVEAFYEDVSANSHWQARLGKPIERVVVYAYYGPAIVELDFGTEGVVWIAAAGPNTGEPLSFTLNMENLCVVFDTTIARELFVPFDRFDGGNELCADGEPKYCSLPVF